MKLYLPFLILLSLAGCGKTKPVKEGIVVHPGESKEIYGGADGYCTGSEVCGGPVEVHGPNPIRGPITFDHVNVVSVPPSHEAQVYAELWRVCAEKHLSYRVHCSIITNESKGTARQECSAEAWNDHLLIGSATPGFEFPSGPTQAAENLLANVKEWIQPQIEPFDTGDVTPH